MRFSSGGILFVTGLAATVCFIWVSPSKALVTVILAALGYYMRECGD